MRTSLDTNQARISQLVELAGLGQKIILAQGDKLLLRVIAIEIEETLAPKKRISGLHRGMVQMSDDFDKPDSFWLGREREICALS